MLHTIELDGLEAEVLSGYLAEILDNPKLPAVDREIIHALYEQLIKEGK